MLSTVFVLKVLSCIYEVVFMLSLRQFDVCNICLLLFVLQSVQKELPEIERQLRAQESGVERLKGDHQREVVRLRAMLRHKDQAIKLLQSERR